MSLIGFDPLFCSSALFQWPEIQRLERKLGTVAMTKDGDFNYTCNFQGFRPSEIKVHHEGDRVIMEAESKQSGPNEHHERSIKRIIKLPNDVDKQSVRCELTDKGEMIVHASKMAIGGPEKRSIPITFKKSQ
jgi:HSP20 family molecular chaperone IbpA